MTSKPQQPRNPLSGFYFKLHFWNQRVTLIKMNWRVRYLFDFDLEIPSAHVCFMLDLFEIKDEDFCSIVQRWTLLPAPSLLLFQSRQTKSWNCVTFKAFPAFQRVLVACGAARRATCGVACGVARRRHPKVTAEPHAAPPPPHVSARFSALPHALLVVLVHTLANFEFYTWTKKHTISLLRKPVGQDINVHTSKKCKILLY